jgi:predicted ATPase
MLSNVEKVLAANNWYVITGAPSTGKTTLLAELDKLGHQIVHETARVLIDQSIAIGLTATELRKDEKGFQENVARLKKKAEQTAGADVLTFFDRGMHDTLAYLRYYGFEVESWVEKLLQTSKYQKVFLLEPLGTFEHDYARTEDEDFAKKMHTLLHDAYAEFGMTPIFVKAAPIPDRIKFILDHVKAERPA